MRGQKVFDFSDKTHSLDGKIATIMGVISIALFIFLSFMSIKSKGSLSYVYGILGVVDFIICISGLIIAIRSFKEEETLAFYKKLGVILNLVMLIITLVLFVSGFMMVMF
ncbi:MAG: DUF6142 family protein [Lachnospiraceae bacterium]|nr:DUF6142 family protein [Lachnospiraceae bacterium]